MKLCVEESGPGGAGEQENVGQSADEGSGEHDRQKCSSSQRAGIVELEPG